MQQAFRKQNWLLAFPIEVSGNARVEDEQQLFAFLPRCVPHGLRLIVQGDFLLLSNRENVHMRN